MTRPGADPAFAARLRHSGLFDAMWYLRRYADVTRLRLDPLTHFLRIGHALGRAPGPGFCPQAYLAANPDVAAAGADPLRHYLTAGQAEGRALHPLPDRGTLPQTGTLAWVAHLRALLETGGCDAAADALADCAQGPGGPAAAEAAFVLALWALHRGQPARAQEWLARTDSPAPMRLIAAAQAGDMAQAHRIRDSAADSPRDSADLDLAAGWIDDPLTGLNTALARSGLAPMVTRPGDAPLLDRLTPATPPARTGTDTDAPLVSVILAAHNAAATLPAALDAILGQSWQALELLVVDDASTDDTAAIAAARATRDPRLRLLRLPRNLGAYGARNAGLAAARGAYLTLHDADDWAHPDRIARQLGFLHRQRGFAGCLSTQARVTPDLRVSRWTGTGALIHENLSSLMLPTALMRDALGAWDRVRVSADSELLRRVRHLFGARAVPLLPEGPLALQRDGGGNATRDSATGMGWFYYGARRAYYEAQQHHHRSAASLRYAPDGPRPFPAPALLQGRRDVLPFDRVYAGLMTQPDATLTGWVDDDLAAGRRVGLVPLYSTDLPAGGGLSVHPALRARIDGEALTLLCFGDTAEAGSFRFLPGQERLAHGLRYLPRVRSDGMLVLAPTG